MVVENRDFNTEYQDADGSKYAYGFDTIVRTKLLERLAPHFVSTEATLELGAYRGDMTQQLLGYFRSLDVVEAASDLAAIVRDRFAGRVEVSNCLIEDFTPTKSYSSIFLVHTLEHLDDPRAVLKRISSWLTETGRLFVVVPNANALSRQIAVHMNLIEHNSAVTEAERVHGHRWTFNLDTLRAIVLSADLQIVDIGGVILKPLANYQFDEALRLGIVSPEYISACDQLARIHPDFSSSIFVVAKRPMA